MTPHTHKITNSFRPSLPVSSASQVALKLPVGSQSNINLTIGKISPTCLRASPLKPYSLTPPKSKDCECSNNSPGSWTCAPSFVSLIWSLFLHIGTLLLLCLMRSFATATNTGSLDCRAVASESSGILADRRMAHVTLSPVVVQELCPPVLI